MILDTNALSALLAGDDAVAEKLSEYQRLTLPAIVLGEYRYGLEHSRLQRQLAGIVDELEDESDILTVDAQTARVYAQVKATLKRNGTPIPENDIWIAALAIQHDMPLLSRDKHFDSVATVERQGW